MGKTIQFPDPEKAFHKAVRKLHDDWQSYDNDWEQCVAVATSIDELPEEMDEGETDPIAVELIDRGLQLAQRGAKLALQGIIYVHGSQAELVLEYDSRGVRYGPNPGLDVPHSQ